MTNEDSVSRGLLAYAAMVRCSLLGVSRSPTIRWGEAVWLGCRRPHALHHSILSAPSASASAVLRLYLRVVLIDS